MLLSDHDRPTERAPGAKPGNLNLLVRLYIYNLYNIRRNGRHILVTSEAISWIIPFPHSQLALEAVEKIWIYMNIYENITYHHLSPSITFGPSWTITRPRNARVAHVVHRCRWPWTTATTCSRARPAAPALCWSARLPRASCAPRGAAVRRPCRGAVAGGWPWEPWEAMVSLPRKMDDFR